MVRRVLSVAVIAFAGSLLALSLVGIVAAWAYNEPVTNELVAQLNELDKELAGAEVALDGAATELARALRILDSVEAALESLARSTTQAQDSLYALGDALDDRVIPDLRTTRDGLDRIRGALEDALSALETVNSLSILPAPIPGQEWLSGLLQATDSLDAEIENVEDLAAQASNFLADVGYVLGGDFSETREGLEGLLDTVTEYQKRIAGWRAQISAATADLPGLVDRVCVILTLFLFWIGLSQAGLVLHGLAAYQGGDPFGALRRSQADEGP